MISKLCFGLLFFGFGMLLGQDTIKYNFLGSKGEDSFKKAFEIGNKIVLFGSVDNGSNQSDIYIAVADEKFDNVDYERIGGSSVEYVQDVVYAADFNSYFLLSTYFDGYSSSYYTSLISRLDSNFNLIQERIFSTNSNVEPQFLSLKEDTLITYIRIENEVQVKKLSLDLLDLDSFYLDYSSKILTDVLIDENEILLLGNQYSDSNGYDVFIDKVSFSGQTINSFLFEDSLNQTSSKIVKKDSFNYIISASSQSLNNHSDYDAILFQVDTAGEVNWLVDHGFASQGPFNDDYGIEVFPLESGQLLFGVFTNTYGLGGGDFHLYLLENDGQYISGNSYGLEGKDELLQILELQSGRFLMVGNSNSGNLGETDILTVTTDTAASGGVKLFNSKLDSTRVATLSIEEPLVGDNLVEILYMGSGQLEISFNSNSTKKSVQISDLQGRILFTKFDLDNKELFDLSNNLNQVLVVTIQEKLEIVSYKLIVR